LHEASGELLGRRRQRVLLSGPEVERLLDQQRLVHEVRVRGDECQLGAFARQVV